MKTTITIKIGLVLLLLSLVLSGGDPSLAVGNVSVSSPLSPLAPGETITLYK